MPVMNWIISTLNYISDFFYSIYIEVWDWPWLPEKVPEFFLDLSYAFNELAYDMSDFFSWLLTVTAQIGEFLTWDGIKSAIMDWLPDIEALLVWFDGWKSRVTSVISDWWYYTRDEVFAWINDLESWTAAQLNTVRDWVLTLISDVESWTVTQINDVRLAILTIISDLEAWTITEFNIVRDWILVLISDVESWTVTQINGVKSAILAIIGDLELWTRAEIDTIMALLSALIDWDALYAWITTWWDDRIADVQGLIDTALSNWTPLLESWQDWKDSVAEFFADPLEWLWARFTDWFLGPEV